MKHSFGYRLMILRQQHNLTQKELADLAGIAPTQISNFETGERLPSLPNFIRLMKALGDHCEFLLDL